MQTAAPTLTLAERLWSKVQKTDGCWLYQGGKAAHGYGQFLSQRAHRVAWAVTYGPIPAGLHVCHRCDVAACVRPDHLFLGTAQDNMFDCELKGRQKGAHRQPLYTMTPKAHADEVTKLSLEHAAGLVGRPYFRRRAMLWWQLRHELGDISDVLYRDAEVMLERDVGVRS